MKRWLNIVAVVFALMTVIPAGGAGPATPGTPGSGPVAFTVHADKVANTINPFIYGHFFEHIYNGGDNGLWGEMVWNRSFEYVNDSAGKWDIKDGVIAQTAIVDGARLVFGDPKWTDYEFTVEGRKVSGNEGFLVLVRAVDDATLFWANISGWTNTQHRLQHLGVPRAADLGQVVRGRINTGQWYKIRVRCEGPRIQAWLDDAQVIDATVPPDLNHGGAVGLGAWQTSVEYRNAKVTGLDGKVLFEGIPELPKAKSAAGIHWDVQAGVDVALVHENVLNDETAVRLTRPLGQDTGMDSFRGISQKALAIRAGETYKGSLFLRGKSAGGVVRVTADLKTAGPALLAEIPLPAATDAWKEIPLQFTAKETSLQATLSIAFPRGADVTLDQVSLMAQASVDNGGFRPDVYKAFADLKPTIIRWPGGCYLEQYHWKNAIGPQAARKKNLIAMWDDYDPNALGTDEYMLLCKKVGAQPLLVVNTGMHVTGTKNAAEWEPWIKEACEWVEYCNGPADSPMGKLRAANGHAEPYYVKYWEIDNELWRSLQPDPAVYAQAVPLFAAAMKKVDPAITIIAHGGNATDRTYDRVLLSNAAASFDVLSIHHYTDAARFDAGVADQDALYRDLIAMIKGSRNPNIQLDVSEWNAQTTDWRTGLYAGGILNTFEKYGANLTIGGPALLFRHVDARDWDNAFINFDQAGYFVAPNYVVMKLWRDHFAPTRVETEGSTGRLNVIATKGDDGRVVLKVVNPANAAVDVAATIDGAVIDAGATPAFELVAPEAGLRARNTMAARDAVHVQIGTATLQKNVVHFRMPAYSAGVVTIAAKPN